MKEWLSHPRRAAALRMGAGYVGLAALASVLALVLREGPPWLHPEPWINAPPLMAMSASAMLGVGVAIALVAVTRLTVSRYGWARRLHEELRPVARDLSLGQILALAGLSSLGEELLFRGLLTPVIGVLASAALFGLVHQMRGPSRWVWAGWATAVGLLFGTLFALTGSLVGPLLAHAIVNAVNLTYLRDHDPAVEA